MSRNLINFSDLTKKDIFDLIELANNFKSEDTLDYRNENLFPDKKIVSMFCEPSTRTKLSFEIAAHNLGAKFIDFDLSNSSMNKGETLEDTLDAMQMIDHRHTAPAYAKGGMHVGLCPIHDLAQLVPIGHLFKRQMFDGGTSNDQPIKFLTTFRNFVKRAVKACHMLGSGGFRLVIAHPDKRQFNLQRCRPN